MIQLNVKHARRLETRTSDEEIGGEGDGERERKRAEITEFDYMILSQVFEFSFSIWITLFLAHVQKVINMNHKNEIPMLPHRTHTQPHALCYRIPLICIISTCE